MNNVDYLFYIEIVNMDKTYRLKTGLITLTKSLFMFSPVFMHLTDMEPSYIKFNIIKQ